MLIDIGNEKYRDLDTNEDFLRVIEKKISWEFAEEIRKKFNGIEEYIEDLRNNSDITYIEQENEDLRFLIEDVNSILQSYIYPIEKGERLYRDKTIKLFREIIKMLDN